MTGTKHPHPHPAEHRQMPHGHHPHGSHPHGADESGHHHVIDDVVVDPPPVGPQPITPPEPDIEIKPGQNIQQAIDNGGPGKVFFLSDPEYTHRLPKELEPKQDQTFILQASLDGGRSLKWAFGCKFPREVTGVRILGHADRQGTLRNFTDNGVSIWKDTICSNFGVADVLGTGVGGGFEGHRETPAIVEFLTMRRCGDVDNLGHDAGAIKMARTGDIRGPIVRHNDIEDIIGNGIWFDVQCCSADVIGNKITGVTRKGVHWEKSGASDEYPQGFYREGLFTVEDNDVVDSGLEQPTRRYDGAFTLVSSMNAHYRRNTARGSRVAGFLYRQDGRLSGDKHGWKAENVIVYADNDFDSTKGCDIPGVTCL